MNGEGPDWFRALIDSASEVYFRYALAPVRRFVYASPSIEALTGHDAEAFYADPALCVGLVPREHRSALRQMSRARRPVSATISLAHKSGTHVPIHIRTVPVIHGRQLLAVEGVARALVAPAWQTGGENTNVARGGVAGAEPTQQRLAALLYEVHDLLHRVLPPAAAGSLRSSCLCAGGVVLDLDRLAVTDAGVAVALTTREVLVLRYLVTHSGRIVTRPQLLADVWGYSYHGDARTVDVHISRLRRKLPSLRRLLVSVKHVGYRLDLPTGRQSAEAAS